MHVTLLLWDRKLLVMQAELNQKRFSVFAGERAGVPFLHRKPGRVRTQMRRRKEGNMNKNLRRKIWRRSVSVLLASSMVLCSPATENGLLSGVLSGISFRAEAAAVEDDTILDSNIVPDAALLKYLQDTVVAEAAKAGRTLNPASLTMKNLSDYTDGIVLTIPSGVKSLTGLGYAKYASEINAGACSGLTTIGESNFADCNMTKVALPSAVKKVEKSAFRNCKSLAQINIGNLTYIGEDAFFACESITDSIIADLKDTLDYLGGGAFRGCTSITTAKVPALLSGADSHTVPKQLFENCKSLQQVSFMDSALTGIGDSAFTGTGIGDGKDMKLEFRVGNSGTYGDRLPSTVSTIGVSAFSSSKIASLDLSNTKVTRIANSTFFSADLSKKIILPPQVQRIGDEAFYKSGLREIDMPNTVTEIGSKSFKSTPNLKTVILSKEIEVIPNAAFQGAGDGTEDSSSGYDTGEGGGEQKPDYSNLVVSFHDSQASDSKIKEIGPSAFNASSLENDFIKDLKRLTKIGDHAFAYADFETLTIPSCVEEIGKEAFNGMYFLREVTFAPGSKVTELPDRVFGGDKLPGQVDGKYMTYGDLILKKVQLPEKLKKMGTQTFAYCTSLETMGYPGKMEEGKIQFPDTLTEMGEECFRWCGTYKETETNEFLNFYLWSPLGILLGNVTSSQKTAGLKEVILPDSLTTAGARAFADNITMDKIVIGNGLKEIPESMCSNCGGVETRDDTVEKHFPKTNGEEGVEAKDGEPVPYIGLREITFSDNVEKIGASAFSRCLALKGFTAETGKIGSAGDLPKNLKEIGDSAFAECKSLRAVRFPTALETIGASAFREASQDISEYYQGEYATYHQYYGLNKIDFTYATNLNKIGDAAFMRTAVDQINLQDTKVTEIPASFCEDCYNLSTVTTGKDVTAVGGRAFYNCYNLSSVTLPLSAKWDKTLFSGSTANNSGKLTVSSTSVEEVVDVIYGRENTLNSNCFHDFPDVSMTLSDATMDENDPKSDLLKNDVNKFVRASREDGGNVITLFGKEEGETAIKLTGLLDLHEMELNNRDVTITISQKYKVNVKRVPITKLTLSSQNLTNEAGEDVLYLNGYSGGAVDLSALYEPEDTTDHVKWSVADSGIAAISTEEPEQSNSSSTIQVTAGQYGETEITASATTIEKKCKVRVRVPANSAEISDTNLTLDTGVSHKLDLTLAYSEELEDKAKDYPDVYEFTSSDETVVRVDPRTGEYTTLADGTATITVKSLVSGHTMSCSITVKAGYVPEAESVAVNKNSSATYENDTLIMYVGDTVKLAANVLPSVADQTVTWSSSDEAVLTAKDGEVKAFKAGQARVTATAANGVSGSCDVIVRAKVESVELSETTLKMTVGDRKSLTAKVLPEEAEQKVEWKSSNESVATVSDGGGVEALKPGKTTITVTAGGDKTATCEVTVSAKTESIKFAEEKATMKVGESKKLSVTVLPADANQTLLWTSSDEKLAKVDSTGTVTALAPGSVGITAASADGVQASCTIEIKAPALGLKIRATNGSTSKIFVKKGASLSLSKFYTNSNCTDTFKFSAKKSKVGSVTEDGQVTTKKPGKLVVTLKAYSDQEMKQQSAQAKFTVQVVKKKKKAKKISVSGKKVVNVGELIGLTAKLKPGKATSRVTWSSKNASVATVDEYGIVTGVAAGKVKITAKISKKKKKTVTVTVNAAPEASTAK